MNDRWPTPGAIQKYPLGFITGIRVRIGGGITQKLSTSPLLRVGSNHANLCLVYLTYRTYLRNVEVMAAAAKAEEAAAHAKKPNVM